MSYVLQIKKLNQGETSGFTEWYIWPVLVLGKIYFSIDGQRKNLRGLAIGLKWLKWGIYISVLLKQNINQNIVNTVKTVKKEEINIDDILKNSVKVSIAKSTGV